MRKRGIEWPCVRCHSCWQLWQQSSNSSVALSQVLFDEEDTPTDLPSSESNLRTVWFFSLRCPAASAGTCGRTGIHSQSKGPLWAVFTVHKTQINGHPDEEALLAKHAVVAVCVCVCVWRSVPRQLNNGERVMNSRIVCLKTRSQTTATATATAIQANTVQCSKCTRAVANTHDANRNRWNEDNHEESTNP